MLGGLLAALGGALVVRETAGAAQESRLRTLDTILLSSGEIGRRLNLAKHEGADVARLMRDGKLAGLTFKALGVVVSLLGGPVAVFKSLGGYVTGILDHSGRADEALARQREHLRLAEQAAQSLQAAWRRAYGSKPLNADTLAAATQERAELYRREHSR